MKRMLFTVVFVTVFSVAVSPIATAQTFNIQPANPVLAGEPLTISLSGLPANTDVKITAERVVVAFGQGDKRALYRADAIYTTESDGRLDLAKAAPKSGTYKGADIRGLFWSMVPTEAEIAADRKVMQVRLSVSNGDKELANATIEFINALSAVKVEKVEKFPGAVFASLPGIEKRPVIIVLGGSEGGSSTAREESPRLASRGFAVLGLPYYSPPVWPSPAREIAELPEAFADIPVDRLNAVYAWLKTRDDVDSSRIAIYGGSKGAEFALIAASNFSWITSVVASVPSDVVWEGWGPGIEPGQRSSFSLNGKPLAFVPYKEFNEEFMGFQNGTDVRIRRPQDKGRAANPAAAVKARIPVEKFKGSLMVIGGQDDQVWASGMMAQIIAEKRAASGLETVALIYTDAGHYLSGNGWGQTTQYNVGPMKSGGTPEGNARAQADAYPKMIAFLKRTLGVK